MAKLRPASIKSPDVLLFAKPKSDHHGEYEVCDDGKE
jgi:hypothetical protein